VPDEKKTNYPGNSHKSRAVVDPKTDNPEAPKAERTKRAKVIKGVAVKEAEKKPTLGQKISAAFTGDDAKSLAEYLLLDVAIPAFKSLVVEATEQGIHRLMYGEARSTRVSGRSNYTNYNRMSTSRSSSSSYRREEPRPTGQRSRGGHDFSNVVLETIRDAEEVIENLRNIYDEYGLVTVSDLYDLVDISSEWTDEKWGWNDIRDFSKRRVPGGYMLELPKPEYLD
jgi:hypothetical protein